jgi:NitT/TauT family transport system ATP-binding protein
MAAAIIQIDRISISFERGRRKRRVLKDISLDIKEGQSVTFFGPNGCGKTTLLKIIAGLIAPDSGKLVFGCKEQTTGILFQNYKDSLLPWRTVQGNIKLPLENMDASRMLAGDCLLDKLRYFGLEKYKDYYTYKLSGGYQQLVALCRALVIQPDVLLLDEPCSSLDQNNTILVQRKILQLLHEFKMTAVSVSHDIDEAILLGDRLVLFGGEPTGILDVIDIDLPWPRKHEMLSQPRFQKIKRMVLRVVQ